MKSLIPIVALLPFVNSQSSGSSSGSSTSTAPPTTAVSTASPSPTLSLSSTIGTSIPLPPTQTWCPSSIFCAGPILQVLNLAQPYSDSKTIVDKPTNKSSQDVINDFAQIIFNADAENNLGNVTEGAVVTFLENDFRGEGQELEPQSLPQSTNSPPFASNVTNPLVQGFALAVHDIWPQLIRGTNESTLCHEGNSTGCESSLIPLNHTFVVPGGRFREQYYWDSFWIIEGLLKSGLVDIVNSTLQNFMDELDTIGFIPNGGRIYYLNRSQPPLFVRMLAAYHAASNDSSILKRGLPLAEKELAWWKDNRATNVTSGYTNKTYEVYRYQVKNSAPRPESYLADLLVTNGPDIANTTYNETQREDLWAELATGAESGWDYSSRFIKEPLLNVSDNTPALRTLNIRAHVPVDLNSLLYNAHTTLASLYGSSNASASKSHQATASALKSAILDLHWSNTSLAFYDYNISANARNTLFSAANFYPLWNGIVPPELETNETSARGYASSVALVLGRYNGTFPATFLTSGLQWDAPNAWPPHQYIIINALKALPSNVTSTPLSNGGNTSTFDQVPSGQLGVTEAQLPVQGIEGGGNFSASGVSADVNLQNGTWVNGGNATSGEGWRDALVRGLANRYMTSALCSFQASGGSIPNLLPQLPANQRITGAENLTGLIFEKFSNNDVDSAGRGGEYTVQAGFGWSNGVVLWIAGEYGNVLTSPVCPVLVASNSSSSGGGSGGSGGGSGGAVGMSMGMGWTVGLVVMGLGALVL